MPWGTDHEWTVADLVAILMVAYLAILAMSYAF